MHSKRLGVGVAVVNRLLYAIGGFDGKERLSTIERYHPEDNAWTIIPSMNIGRSGAGVAALNQYIYVVGGFDGVRQLSSVERFDTEQLIWSRVASIKIARSALSLTVLDGKLYAMGGFDGHHFLSIVEVYDPDQNIWEDGTPLTSGRSGHASAVIFEPSCANSFSNYLRSSSMDTDNGDSSWPDNNTNGEPNASALSATNAPATQNTFASFSGSVCTNCTKKSILFTTTYFFYNVIKRFINYSYSVPSFTNSIINTSHEKFQSADIIVNKTIDLFDNIIQICNYFNRPSFHTTVMTSIILENNHEIPLCLLMKIQKNTRKKCDQL